MDKQNKISVEQYAASGAIKNRRGHNYSPSYIYRLIKKHLNNDLKKPLPFAYEMEGEKERIWIVID